MSNNTKKMLEAIVNNLGKDSKYLEDLETRVQQTIAQQPPELQADLNEKSLYDQVEYFNLQHDPILFEEDYHKISAIHDRFRVFAQLIVNELTPELGRLPGGEDLQPRYIKYVLDLLSNSTELVLDDICDYFSKLYQILAGDVQFIATYLEIAFERLHRQIFQSFANNGVDIDRSTLFAIDADIFDDVLSYAVGKNYITAEQSQQLNNEYFDYHAEKIAVSIRGAVDKLQREVKTNVQEKQENTASFFYHKKANLAEKEQGIELTIDNLRIKATGLRRKMYDDPNSRKDVKALNQYKKDAIQALKDGEKKVSKHLGLKGVIRQVRAWLIEQFNANIDPHKYRTETEKDVANVRGELKRALM